MAASVLVIATLGLAVGLPRRLGTNFPPSFYLWAALPVSALVVAALGWRQQGWSRRLATLMAVPVLAAFGAVQVNAHYAYIPTIGDLSGKLPGEVSARRLFEETSTSGRATDVHKAKLESQRATVHSGVAPLGLVGHLDIPAPVSRFHHRRSWIWLPPAWGMRPRPGLPVVMLLAGTPDAPAGWLRAGRALDVASGWRSHAPRLAHPIREHRGDVA